jgi:hypothetical protein
MLANGSACAQGLSLPGTDTSRLEEIRNVRKFHISEKFEIEVPDTFPNVHTSYKRIPRDGIRLIRRSGEGSRSPFIDTLDFDSANRPVRWRNYFGYGTKTIYDKSARAADRYPINDTGDVYHWRYNEGGHLIQFWTSRGGDSLVNDYAADGRLLLHRYTSLHANFSKYLEYTYDALGRCRSMIGYTGDGEVLPDPSKQVSTGKVKFEYDSRLHRFQMLSKEKNEGYYYVSEETDSLRFTITQYWPVERRPVPSTKSYFDSTWKLIRKTQFGPDGIEKSEGTYTFFPNGLKESEMFFEPDGRMYEHRRWEYVYDLK